MTSFLKENQVVLLNASVVFRVVPPVKQVSGGAFSKPFKQVQDRRSHKRHKHYNLLHVEN